MKLIYTRRDEGHVCFFVPLRIVICRLDRVLFFLPHSPRYILVHNGYEQVDDEQGEGESDGSGQ